MLEKGVNYPSRSSRPTFTRRPRKHRIVGPGSGIRPMCLISMDQIKDGSYSRHRWWVVGQPLIPCSTRYLDSPERLYQTVIQRRSCDFSRRIYVTRAADEPSTVVFQLERNGRCNGKA